MIITINNTEFEVDKIIYVSPSGNNNNDGLSISSPVQTYEYANSLCTLESAIYLTEGNYIVTDMYAGDMWSQARMLVSAKIVTGDLGKVNITLNGSCYNGVLGFAQNRKIIGINFNFTSINQSNYWNAFLLGGNNIEFYNCYIQLINCYCLVYYGVARPPNGCHFFNCIINNDRGIIVSYYNSGYGPYVNEAINCIFNIDSPNFTRSYCLNLTFNDSFLSETPLVALNEGDPLILNIDETRSHIGLFGGPFAIDYKSRLYIYFLTKGDKILNNNINNDINSITLNDFLKFGYYKKEQKLNNDESIIFAAKIDKIPIKFIEESQQIISNKINLSNVKSVNKIEVNGIYINDIKCLINNGYNWYTYKDQNWEIINSSKIDNDIIETLGVNINEIKNIQNWNEFFEKDKFIMFTVLLKADSFDNIPIISNIRIEYNENPSQKTKINDDLYSVINYSEYIELTWKTANKKSIEIILKENKGAL